MNEKDLAWLAGIWDGEGTISLFFVQESNGSKKIKPIIAVVNTDIAIINEVQKILLQMECNFYSQEVHPKNKKHKLQWRLITSNSKYIKIFLETLNPYLRGDKKHRGEILLRYITQRMDKIQKRNG